MEEYGRMYSIPVPNGSKDDRMLKESLERKGYRVSCGWYISHPDVEGFVGEIRHTQRSLLSPVRSALITVYTNTRKGKSLATFLSKR